jgi:hypothetical protein
MKKNQSMPEKAAEEVEKNQSMPTMKKKKTNEINNGY